MRNQSKNQSDNQIDSLRSEIQRLEKVIQHEVAHTQDLIRQLHNDMWNMVQAMNASLSESVGLSVVSRLSNEMERVRAQIGDIRQDVMGELRRPQ